MAIRSIFGFNALGTLSPDGPTSIFSTLLSSNTGKLVTCGWGDFWEVLFIFWPSCFTWFFSYCLILSLGFFYHIFLQFRETKRHFSYVRHQRNEKSKLDLTPFQIVFSQFKGFRPFFSNFKFLRKWYEIDIFEFSGSPMTNDANIWHFYGSADFIYVFWFNKYGVVAHNAFMNWSIMHIPISQLHAQWHWCLHFSMSLNSQCFPQFHPTVMLVAYVNFFLIIIRQNFFPVSFSGRIS